MTTRELAKHIYEKVKSNNSEKNDIDMVIYIENLMITHFDLDYNIGYKGFESILDGKNYENIP